MILLSIPPGALKVAIAALLVGLGILSYYAITAQPFEVPLDDDDENSYS